MQSQSSSSWWLGACLCARALSLVLPWLVHLLVADVLLSLLLPLKYLDPSRVYHVASAIAEPVWAGIQRICLYHNGAVIGTSGDKLPFQESAIVVSNHVAWSDFYLIQEVGQKTGMLGRFRWFAKKSLRYVPFLGWGLWAMGMPLISRRWTEDREEMNRLFANVRNGKLPIWLIFFCEGTRYKPEAHRQTMAWCKANDRPIPKYTLFPRTKGFVSTVQHMRKSHITAVYDVTIAYADERSFMSAPSFLQTLYLPEIRKRFRMHIHTERFELASLPATDEGLAEWLEKRWVAKGEKLVALKQELDRGHPW